MLPVDDLRASGRAIVMVRKTLAELAEDVCARRGDVASWEVFGRGRSRRIVEARDEVVWQARQLGYTLHMIGRRFPRPENLEGCMDHSSVHEAERRHGRLVRAATMLEVRRADDEAAVAYLDYLRERAPRCRELAA